MRADRVQGNALVTPVVDRQPNENPDQKGRYPLKTHHSKSIGCLGILLLGIGWSSLAVGQTDTNSPVPDLKKQVEQLTLENNLAQQQLQKDLATLTSQKQRLELENGI